MELTKESFASSGTVTNITKRRERRLVRTHATDISMVARPRMSGVGTYTASQAIRAQTSNPVFLELRAKLDLPKLEKELRRDMKGQGKNLFWDWVRRLIDAKYRKTDVAFRIFSDQRDAMMSTQQFVEMCESLGLCIDPRILKTLFEMTVCREFEIAWSFQDFQSVLLGASLDRIRGRLSAYNTSVRRIGIHVDNFIKRLALETGEVNRRHAVARFQKKLALPFCMEVRFGLQRVVERADKFATPITPEDFLRVVDKATVLQNYELNMLRNIYDRIDRNRCGSVNVPDLVVGLALLATECEDQSKMRMEKLKFLFSVFDADCDGCVTYEEILRLFCSIAIFSTIARGDQPSYDADMALGDELSLAKARRLYDFTTLYLNQIGIHDLCTFQELWSVFETYPKVMEELIPGTYSNSIMWVLRPLPSVRSDDGSKRAVATTKQNGSTGAVLSTERAFSKSTDCRLPAGSMKRKSISHPVVSITSPQVGRRPASQQSKTEHFRIQAAIRFRHAVRGEWDVVNVLQSAPPQSREGFNGNVSSRLPSLAPPASSPSAAARGHISSAGSPETLPGVTWAEAANKFNRQRKEKDWQTSHRQSIVNWSKGAETEEPRTISRHGQARSLPNLKQYATQSPNGAKRVDEKPSPANANIAAISPEEAKVLEDMPSEPVRFGKDAKEALTRVKHVCKALQAGGSSHSQQVGPVVMDRFDFECRLCHGRHDVQVPYMA